MYSVGDRDQRYGADAGLLAQESRKVGIVVHYRLLLDLAHNWNTGAAGLAYGLDPLVLVEAAMRTWLRDRRAAVALAASPCCRREHRLAAVRPGPALSAAVGLDIRDLFVRGEVWRLLTSVLWARDLDLLVTVFALVIGVGACERLIGTRRVLSRGS